MDQEELQTGYYAVIPAPVLNDEALRWAAMVLYAKITSFAKNTGFCYAKNDTLIREMTRTDPQTGSVNSITERTLQSLLAELRDRGHIHMDVGPWPPDKRGVVRKGRRIFIGARLADLQRDEENFTPENNFAKGMNFSSPHIKGNRNKENNYTPLPPIAELVSKYAGNDGELESAILGLLRNRAALKPKPKPVVTTRAMNGILRELDKLSGGKRAVKLALLDKAIINNWLNVYPLRADELPAESVTVTAQEEGELNGI